MNSNGSESTKRRLALGALSNWLAFAAIMMVGFFLTPYFIRHLGEYRYGIWALVEALLAYFTLFDLGLAAGIVRYVARFKALNDREQLSQLVATASRCFAVLGAACWLLASIAVIIMTNVATLDDQHDVLWFGLIMAFNLALTIPGNMFPAILDGLEQFGRKSLVRIICLGIKTIGTIVLLQYSTSLVNLAWLHLGLQLLEMLALGWLARRGLPGVSWARPHFRWATVNLLKGYSLHAFLAMVAGRITIQTGPLIVASFFGPGPVTAYVVALRLVEFAKALLRSATNALTPAVSSLDAQGRLGEIQAMIVKGTRWVLYLILPVQLGLMILGERFVAIWLADADLAARVYPILVLGSATLTLVLAQSIAARVLYGLGRLRWFARFSLVEAAVNLIVTTAIAASGHINEAMLGLVIPNALFCIWVIGYTLRATQLRPGRYLGQAWVKPLLLAAILAAFWSLYPGEIRHWGHFVLAIALGVGLQGLLVLMVEKGSLPLQRLGFRPRAGIVLGR